MKAFLIILVVVVIIGGGVAAFMFISKDDSNHESTQTESSASPETSAITRAEDIKTGEVAVTIKNRAYSPKTLTVTKGTTITWTNEDSIQHNVISDSDSEQNGLDGPLLNKGQSYSFTFDTVGVYTYHCTPHPDMTGIIEVVE